MIPSIYAATRSSMWTCRCTMSTEHRMFRVTLEAARFPRQGLFSAPAPTSLFRIGRLAEPGAMKSRQICFRRPGQTMRKETIRTRPLRRQQNGTVTGHIGYFSNGVTDQGDYWKFTIPVNGKVVVQT